MSFEDLQCRMVTIVNNNVHLKLDERIDLKCSHHQKGGRALAGVAQWIECQPRSQKVAGSIPSQGTCLGCEPGP